MFELENLKLTTKLLLRTASELKLLELNKHQGHQQAENKRSHSKILSPESMSSRVPKKINQKRAK